MKRKEKMSKKHESVVGVKTPSVPLPENQEKTKKTSTELVCQYTYDLNRRNSMQIITISFMSRSSAVKRVLSAIMEDNGIKPEEYVATLKRVEVIRAYAGE